MSQWLDSMIDEWARDVVLNSRKGPLLTPRLSGFSGINVVERLLKNPGISVRGIGHAVLWWPSRSKSAEKRKRMATIYRAMHQIDSISQICLIVDAKRILREDGNIFTVWDLKRNSSLTVGEIRERISRAKRTLRKILDSA